MERPDSRLIRVFLSSTFVDFQEERSLLVQQVFPSLRRRARSREVEIVDVDLRWGVTAEMTERGETLPLCLGEIDRCRPYFISLLGERYGWVPPPNYYKPELLERQPWLKERMGGASVTELEILHGVLRNPEMAGHAFFYFREPAYAQAQEEPGWVAESPSERQRLEALKKQIRTSSFPVVEDLPDPQAIAARIEADLWQLIESQFPEQEPADALEREARKHAEFRRARTGKGQYIGGEASIQQVEQWISEGQQQILITGESGSGKSALIANWMQHHQKEHPDDLIHAHHLGCTNDASALRPMLGRMIDTASQQLQDAGLTTKPIAVPEDWWELVAKVAETLQTLGNCCHQQGRRWIWVLDGLDRLDPDDQKALPWLPPNLPAGIQVVVSALACPAREILNERGYTTLTIQPLRAEEQQQLIQQYLNRYTKELDGGLHRRILAHPLAGSPLFLKVLLEELRQCGQFDTLQTQLAFYLRAATVDDLYERVLERLETDGHGEAVNKAMTSVWASRAGLSEPELQAITGLAPLQWAPIDLALEKAFGRNGNRLVFDHDYLRIAVEDRYLPTEEQQRQAHSELADWFEAKEKWDERGAEELPWQYRQAERLNDLRDLLLNPVQLADLSWHRSCRETINYWLAVKHVTEGELDDLIADAVEEEIEGRKENAGDQIWFMDRIAALLDEAGLYRQLLLSLRTLSLELEEATEDRDEKSMVISLARLANAHEYMGYYDEAVPLYLRCLEASERLLGPEHPATLTTVGNLAGLFQDKGDYEQAEAYFKRDLEASERLLGPEHPHTLITVGNLGLLYSNKGDYEQAEAFYTRCLEASERLLGPEHPDTLATVGNLAGLFQDKGDYEQAEDYYTRCLEARERLLGPEHPATLITVGNLGLLYSNKGDYEQAEAYFKRDLEASERLLGPEHPHTLAAVGNLAGLFQDKGDYEQAEVYYTRCLEARERLLGPEHPATLITVGNLGLLYIKKGDYDQAEAYFKRDLEASERLLGPEHPNALTIVGNLAGLFQDKGDYEQAEVYYTRCLEARKRLLGPEHPATLTTIGNLGLLYSNKGDYGQAEALYTRCLEARERLLGPEHPATLSTVNNLAVLFQDKGDYEQAEAFYTRCLEARERLLGPEHPATLSTVGNLGGLYYNKGDYEQAEAFYTRGLEARERLLGPEHPDTLTTIGNLGLLYSDKGDYEQAEALYTRCLEAHERLLGPEHPVTLTTVHNLGLLYSDKGHYEQAEDYYTRCLEARERLLGPEHRDTLTTVHNLGLVYSNKGDYGQAEDYYTRCLEARERLLGPDHPDTLNSVYFLAKTLSDSDRRSEAIPLRRRELAWCRPRNGNTDPGTLTSINGLAIDLRETGTLEEAEALFRELVAGRQQVLEPTDFNIGCALGSLAITLEEAGKLEEALMYAQQALVHRLQHEGPDGWWTNRERLVLARVLHKLERSSEAINLLDQLEQSLNAIQVPDQEDVCLLVEALDLQRIITDNR